MDGANRVSFEQRVQPDAHGAALDRSSATEHSSPFLSANRDNNNSSASSRFASKVTSSAPAVFVSEQQAPVVSVPPISHPPLYSSTHYSDRFIPSRLASEAFCLSALGGGGTDPSLLSVSPVPSPAGSGSSNSQGSAAAGSLGLRGREDTAAAYALLLKSELLSGSGVGAGVTGFGTGMGLGANFSSCSGAGMDTGASSSSSSGSNAGWTGEQAGRESNESAGWNLNSGVGSGRNVFRYMDDVRHSASGLSSLQSPLSLAPIGLDASLSQCSSGPRKAPRKIARSPFKVLDAPALQDDFYLNLVDWSSSNLLAVGLGSCVYLWNALTSKVTKLCDVGPSDAVSAVSWTQRGTLLSIGTSNGKVQVWDVVRGRCVRVMGGHRMRCGTLSWATHLLTTGSRDRSVLHRDVRSPADFVARLSGHKSEVCGLKWSPDERELASGGNDNQLLIWNLSSCQPVIRFQQHQAAVKALAWSPHQHGLLASGGGTADRCIRFWNTTTASSLSSMDTGSQVCNLVWSRNANEIASTHGYSHNQIVIWKYPSMSKLATLTGHTMRVLFLAVSPDGQTIVTGAGDETLRFWTVFPPAKPQASSSKHSLGGLERSGIR